MPLSRRALLYLPLALLAGAALFLAGMRVNRRPPEPTVPLVTPNYPGLAPYLDNQDTRNARQDGYNDGYQNATDAILGHSWAPLMPRDAD